MSRVTDSFLETLFGSSRLVGAGLLSQKLRFELLFDAEKDEPRKRGISARAKGPLKHPAQGSR